jgi:hypothetical protein
MASAVRTCGVVPRSWGRVPLDAHHTPEVASHNCRAGPHLDAVAADAAAGVVAAVAVALEAGSLDDAHDPLTEAVGLWEFAGAGAAELDEEVVAAGGDDAAAAAVGVDGDGDGRHHLRPVSSQVFSGTLAA